MTITLLDNQLVPTTKRSDFLFKELASLRLKKNFELKKLNFSWVLGY